MKRIASLLLLSLFLFNIIGYYALFMVRDANNRATIRETLEDAICLQTIQIHRSDLKNMVFKDEGKEIYYQGEVYDIESISSYGDQLIFHCIHDSTEKELLDDLALHVKNNTDAGTSHDKKQNNSSKQLLKDLFLHQINNVVPISFAVEYCMVTCNLISFTSPLLPLPPPEICIS